MEVVVKEKCQADVSECLKLGYPRTSDLDYLAFWEFSRLVCPWDSGPLEEKFLGYRLRWLLARRLLREGRSEEALPFFPQQLREEAKAYINNLTAARSAKKMPDTQRAEKWWSAAQTARHRGLELMGTEREPDNAMYAGQFPAAPIRTERLQGLYKEIKYVMDAQQNYHQHIETRPIVLPISAKEKQRLLKLEQPAKERSHYRSTAAKYAWNAAKLLPDQTEHLAEILNTGGLWLQRLTDAETRSQKFYNAIEGRCGNTVLGKQALARRGFVQLE